jgi:hypothetical protein
MFQLALLPIRYVMKIFLSWSGEESHEYALLLERWLPSVLQAVEAYVSSTQIESGTRWNAELTRELAINSYGILCLTEGSKSAPWIIFEAGALSKAVDKSHVVPLLFDLRQSDIDFPLAQFQMRLANKSDIHALVSDINKAAEGHIETTRLEEIFSVWWPNFETRQNSIRETFRNASSVTVQNDTPPILEEILEAVRAQLRILSSPEAVLPYAYLRSALQEATNRVDPDAIAIAARSVRNLALEVSRLENQKTLIEITQPLIQLIFALKHISRRTGMGLKLERPLNEAQNLLKGAKQKATLHLQADDDEATDEASDEESTW